MSDGWVGVDLDRTLAYFDKSQGPEHIGPPITAMLARVKAWLAEGRDVRIFTARVFSDGTIEGDLYRAVATMAISEWCERWLGKRIPITCSKDYNCTEIWDDRAIQIEANMGRRVDGKE